MTTIRKKFDVDPSFPFTLTYRDTKTRQRELPDHLHDWYELVYVHSGKGIFFIDQSFYDMRQGDLFIIPGNTIHRAMPDHETPVTSTALFFGPLLIAPSYLGESFSYLYCFDHCRSTHAYKLACSPSLQSQIESSLLAINRELHDMRFGYHHATALVIQQILLQVNREVAWKGPSPRHASSVGPAWLRNTLLYIDQHLTEDISLPELSARASISPAHFSRQFKQLTGMTVTELVISKRIIMAKELLRTTEQNVAMIAADCGIQSLPHFHRLFKRLAGVTPSVYRRESIRPGRHL